MPKGKARGGRADLRLQLPRTPSPAHLAEIYQDLLRRPHVLGCFIGREREEGRLTSRLSLVCAVEKKVPRDELHPEQELVPEIIPWTRGKARPGRLATDVQVLSQPFHPANGEVAGPGGGVTGGGSRATVGIALRHPVLGDVVTTAGHLVLGGPGEVTFPEGQQIPVQLASSATDGTLHAGLALKAVRSATAD